jgi:hypothetical protein
VDTTLDERSRLAMRVPRDLPLSDQADHDFDFEVSEVSTTARGTTPHSRRSGHTKMTHQELTTLWSKHFDSDFPEPSTWFWKTYSPTVVDEAFSLPR